MTVKSVIGIELQSLSLNNYECLPDGYGSSNATGTSRQK